MEIDKKNWIIPARIAKFRQFWKCSKISRMKRNTIDFLITLESPRPIDDVAEKMSNINS
jgi:hypothetical protein